MSLAAVHELAAAARAAGAGLGAFNVILLEHAEAIVGAAEQAERPVVLQLSQNTVRYHGALAPLGKALLALARQADVPVGVHLDHATEQMLVGEALRLGFTSVMFDGSAAAYEQNVGATTRVAERCHRAGVTIEAELGEIGGKDGAHAPAVRTDPDEARAFVAATGVDLLAVAVGTSHAMHEQAARVDTGHIARLRAAVDVPLVLHGSSGVPDEDLPAIVGAGMTKVNLATTLNLALTRSVRETLTEQPELVDPRQYLAPARAAVRQRVARLLGLLSSPRAPA